MLRSVSRFFWIISTARLQMGWSGGSGFSFFHTPQTYWKKSSQGETLASNFQAPPAASGAAAAGRAAAAIRWTVVVLMGVSERSLREAVCEPALGEQPAAKLSPRVSSPP